MKEAFCEGQSLQERLFRRVPEGWVFTTPGLWPLGGSSTFLVNDARKAELIARLERWERIEGLSLLLMICIIAVSGLVGIRSKILDVIIVGLFVVTTAGAAGVLKLWVIRPILADTVATPIRVNFWDALLACPSSLAQTSSFLRLTVAFLCLALVTTFMWYGALNGGCGKFACPAPNDPHFSLLVLLVLSFISIVPTVVLAGALFLKFRAR